jgi:hypothetical protein
MRKSHCQSKSFSSECALLCLSVFVLVTPLLGAPYQGPGTRKMAERLEQIARESRATNNIFMNLERAELLRAQLDRALASPDSPDKAARVLTLQSRYATELLLAGKTPESIAEFTRLEQVMSGGAHFGRQNVSSLRFWLALAHLRLAEQENCQAHHTAESCLMPIREGGVHQLQAGSRTAIRYLTEQLKDVPDDLRARWLLNLAYMTVGEYPDTVPAQWRIPPKAFESDYDIKRFPDVAHPLGLDLNDLAGGVVMDDFDNDGFLDLMISSWGLRDQLRLFRNNGDGTFRERTDEAGLRGELGGLNLFSADYNNDGQIDVLVTRGAWFGSEGHHPNSLLRNNGNGTFDDVTEAAGLLSFHPTQAVTWFDFNHDGWLDVFIGNETTPGDTNRCELFRNNGNGTFTECAAEVGVDALGYVKAVASGDYNNDGWPDLYLSCRGQPNFLFRNDGPQTPSKDPKGRWKFTNVAAEAGVTEPRYSFPCWFFDYDNDGWLDIFVAGFAIRSVGDIAADYLGLPHTAERARLYHNNGDGTFQDVTREAGLYKVLLGMSANFGDLDNDGFLDLYLGTGDPDLSTVIPNRMFRNAGGKYFQDVTTSGGFGHIQKGHGIAFGDLDHDGDQDLYVSIGGAYAGDFYWNVLFENPGHRNHWLKLQLIGVKSNRSAIGARIKVTVETAAGPRTIYKTVNTGGSFGASPLRQEIGLGQARAITEVEILWPASGTKQVFKNLQLDHCYVVREGEATTAVIQLKPFPLAGPKGTADHGHERNQTRAPR